MRKIFLLILTLLLAFNITACNKTNDNNNKEVTNKENIEVIPAGTAFKSDKYEITVNDYSWVNKIEPTKAAEQFNCYDAEDNSTLLKINAKIKNLNTDAVNIDGIAYEATINGKYNYKLQTVIDKNGNLEPLAMVKPLEEVNAVIFTNIPNEAKNNAKSLRLYCGYNDGYDNQFDTFDSKDHFIEFALPQK